jgi:hypothetical protein
MDTEKPMSDGDGVTGIAWYRRDQGPRLRTLASDVDKLEESYEACWSPESHCSNDRRGACALSASTSTSTSWCAGVEPRIVHLTAPRGAAFVASRLRLTYEDQSGENV